MDSAFHPAILAIASGNLDKLRELIATDPTLATRRSRVSHPSLLCFVAVDGGLGNIPQPEAAAEVLIEAGSELDDPLLAAASVDARGVADALIDAGANVSGAGPWTPLDEALYWSHTELAHHLVARGAQPRSLRAAAGVGDAARVDACFDDDGGLVTSLAGELGSPWPDRVPPRPHDPEDVVDQAFVIAVLNDELDVAEGLLGRGALIDGRPPGFHWGGTALHGAISIGALGAVDWLLDHGADPAIVDTEHGADAAGWARHFGHDDLAERLAS